MGKDVVLVTGGAGFIGSHLVDRLLKEGLSVKVVDDLSTGLRSNLTHVEDQIEFVEGDICDVELCFRMTEGVKWVFHQAALGSVPRSVEDPASTHAINVTGTLNLLMAARDNQVERFVFAASSAAYGDVPVLPKVETQRPQPLSPYAVSKLACEYYLSAFHAVYGLPTVSLRYFNIFGPRQRPDGPYAAVIPLFVDSLRRGKAATIFGDGEQTRDFTFVSNAVDANLLAARAGSSAFGKVFNIATGSRVSVNQLYGEIAQFVGSDVQPHYAPPRAGDVRDSLADIDQAKSVLGYAPTTDLRTGLKETVAYFMKHQ